MKLANKKCQEIKPSHQETDKDKEKKQANNPPPRQWQLISFQISTILLYQISYLFYIELFVIH